MPRQKRLLARLRERASGSPVARLVLLPAASFLRVEERSGGPLLIASSIALVWANSPWGESYSALWQTELAVEVGGYVQRESLRHWINDLLLPLFFLVIGMEVKHEVLRGELSSPRRAALPVAAALGGVVVPAGLYLLVASGSEAVRGWGIPVATDIAFALAILALLGPRAPESLKILVLAFAALDDVVGVLIIAVFYSSDLSWVALGAASLLLAVAAALNALKLRSMAVFGLLGFAVWLCVLRSGVHATIAGVAMGLLASTRSRVEPRAFADRAEDLLERFRGGGSDAREEALGELEEALEGMEPPSERLAHLINPWVSYAILPLFALANAGVPLGGPSLGAAAGSPAAWGVVAGLLVGKPLGILLFAKLAVSCRLAHLPEDLGWRHIAGMGLLAGIGFTVSLFIAQLAFGGEAEQLRSAKIAVLLASVSAGGAGWVLLRGVGGGEADPEESEAGS